MPGQEKTAPLPDRKWSNRKPGPHRINKCLNFPPIGPESIRIWMMMTFLIVEETASFSGNFLCGVDDLSDARNKAIQTHQRLDDLPAIPAQFIGQIGMGQQIRNGFA